MMPYAFRKHEKDFENWKNTGMNDIKPETRSFIENLERKDRKCKLWKNQKEGILRTIYSYEILENNNLLLNIVTGGGKTVIIAGCIAWLKMAYNVDKFLIVVPNTIVRDRLKRDFVPEIDKKNFTTIRISRRNKERLDKIGKRGESFDEILDRLISKK